MSAHSERIQQILKDDDFMAVVDAYKRRLTGKVMAAATSDEDRVTLLAQYHAVDAVLKGLASAAQNFKKE